MYLDLRGEAERVTLPYSLWQSSKGTAGFGQAVVKILADCGIAGDDATQVSEVFHWTEVGAIDAGLRKTVRLSSRGLVRHFNLLQADDGEAAVLDCIREAVDDVL